MKLLLTKRSQKYMDDGLWQSAVLSRQSAELS